MKLLTALLLGQVFVSASAWSTAKETSADPTAADPTAAVASQTGSTSTLTLRFEGFTSDDGTLTLAMWNDKQYWLSDGNAVRAGTAPITDGMAKVVFENLPHGEYAISAYHDENGNGKLDTGMFGIPKEPIGTSNDAKIRFGPPKYKDAKFVLDQPDLDMNIPVRKLF